jgi:hypothetical protein
LYYNSGSGSGRQFNYGSSGSATLNFLKLFDLLLGYLKFKETQKKFQIDNGLRIHERGGPIEKVGFPAPFFLISVGSEFHHIPANCFMFLFASAFFRS